MSDRVRLPLIIATALLIQACGAGTTSEPQQQATNSLADQLRKLEEQGVLPVLDRGPGLAGKDEDGDGVRDDIARFIDALPEPAPIRNALRQNARATQATLTVDHRDRQAVRSVGNIQADAITCLHRRSDSQKASNYGRRIVSLTVNTKERFLAYANFNRAMSGMVITLPDSDTCEE